MASSSGSNSAAKAYYSLWDSLAKGGLQGGIIYKIWMDKKNKKSLEKLIPLLVKSDYSWLHNSRKPKTKTIYLGSVAKLFKDDDGGKKEKAAAQTAKTDMGNGDDGGEKGKAAAEATNKVYNSTPLLIATIAGTVPIVKEILEQHPQAAEHVNYNERNILHLAIKYRQKPILNLIRSKPTVLLRLNERIDCDGNTILHQAADRSYYTIALSQNLIGPAMQLQAELRWFMRVEEILPPHYSMHHNKKELTAEELFYYEHNALLESAQEWIKETAQSCSTVAVLVATVVFAAAYAIPGGNDQSGRPIFQDDPLFLLFTCMDVVAIACSLSSVAFFSLCPLLSTRVSAFHQQPSSQDHDWIRLALLVHGNNHACLCRHHFALDSCREEMDQVFTLPHCLFPRPSLRPAAVSYVSFFQSHVSEN